jgi:hypothetical protein
MHKHFPHVKTFVRAFDIENGVMLEKAGATAVVPEILEPSLQLAAAVLSQVRGRSVDKSPHREEGCGERHVCTLGCTSFRLTPHMLPARLQLNMPDDEVAETIRSFRKAHIRELTELAALSGSSLGYGSKGSGKQADNAEEEDEEMNDAAVPTAA